MRELRPQIDFGLFTVHGASDDPVGAEMRRTLETTNTPWFRGTSVPMKCGGMLPAGMALARAVQRFQPNLIHFHSETPEACGAMSVQLAGARARVPMVRTIHNSVFWRYWPRVGRWCDRRLADAAIACVSGAALDEFKRYRSDSGAHPPPFAPRIIYNGVPTPRREPAGTPASHGVIRLLFAGRFEAQKGTDVLCAAIPRVQLPAGTSARLTCVGHGSQQSNVERLAQHPPPGWTVAVRGPVGDLSEVWSDFDLLIVPSRFEGLGLVAIEATLAGLPVVAADAPGLREALPENYPWRATPGDAQSLANALGAACGARSHWPEIVRSAQSFAASRFSPGTMGAEYRKLYEMQLSLSRRP
jgi:glycosyltransferase involved in cell wall biosynthesis